MDYLELAQNLSDRMVEWRRDFHQHPELSFKEHRTARIIEEELEKMGYKVQSGIAETGVVGILQGDLSGPTIMLRFDIDALPIQEDTQRPYSSTTPGVMHACGHDAHIAIGLGVARIFQSFDQSFPGTLKFVFQPAEEKLKGARRMIDEGVLENPKPDYMLALHVWNDKQVGWIGVSPGPVFASADLFEIEVRGVGGHAAVPQQAKDPIAAAAHIITALQTILSRNVDPLQVAALSVTQVKAGDAFNTIPNCAELKGTIRTFDRNVRDMVVSRIKEISSGVALGLGCEVDITIEQLVPATVNDAFLASLIEQIAKKILPDFEIETEYRDTGSEDASFFMQEIPGCYFFIGSANSDTGLDKPHHNSAFDFDERAMVWGAALIAATTFQLLENQKM